MLRHLWSPRIPPWVPKVAAAAEEVEVDGERAVRATEPLVVMVTSQRSLAVTPMCKNLDEAVRVREEHPIAVQRRKACQRRKECH